ncbi:hypothetical protein SH528x_003217 [Novipirellula sp. SH528]|uniref:hypothetical protein n=1 Tax=Novipirellula sp. SH528 TaxID=3454466 RepID=UPI003F9F5D6F
MRLFAKFIAVGCVLSVLSSCPGISAQESETKSDPSRVRVGTFDSRLVATAYVRSQAFQQRLAKMQSDLKDAKASGDEKRIKQLEADGQALQGLVHKQAFSTRPVHDILETIKEKMPEIAKQAEVDVVVSKWDFVFLGKDVDAVDITDLMVEPFFPTDETLKVLASLRERDPVPLDEISKHK